MSGEANSDSGWPNGWLIAAVAGVIAAILARWIGDTGMAAAVLVGVFVFLVFGVLLGMFWGVPVVGHDDGHAHQDHAADDGHKHGDSAVPDDGFGQYHHLSPAAAPMSSVAAAPFMPPTMPMSVTPPTAAPVAEVVAVAVRPNDPEAFEGAAKPVALAGPRGGKGDDLKTIEGIGPGLEKLCHELGIFHFDQIAGWGPGEIAWMDGNLKGFKGRVSRDKWVRQAKLIGEVGIPEFLRRAKTNDY